MILRHRQGIHILSQVAQVNGHALDEQFAMLGQTILHTDMAQVEGMRLLGHAGAIIIPVELVEGEGSLPNK